MMGELHQQSNAEGFPLLVLLRHPECRCWWELAACRGCTEGWGACAMWEPGRLGAAVGKSGSLGLFAKRGRGGERLRGEQTAFPLPLPRVVLLFF